MDVYVLNLCFYGLLYFPWMDGFKCENRTIIVNLILILADIHNKMEKVHIVG
jgi:hypothetical protein